jgi:hypothetical protein
MPGSRPTCAIADVIDRRSRCSAHFVQYCDASSASVVVECSHLRRHVTALTDRMMFTRVHSASSSPSCDQMPLLGNARLCKHTITLNASRVTYVRDVNVHFGRHHAHNDVVRSHQRSQLFLPTRAQARHTQLRAHARTHLIGHVDLGGDSAKSVLTQLLGAGDVVRCHLNGASVPAMMLCVCTHSHVHRRLIGEILDERAGDHARPQHEHAMSRRHGLFPVTRRRASSHTHVHASHFHALALVASTKLRDVLKCWRQLPVRRDDGGLWPHTNVVVSVR